MKVKDLVEYLERQDPEAIVIVANDSEGNTHAPLDTINNVFYVEEDEWSGKIFDTIKDIKHEHGKDFKEYERAVCLWPM